MKERLLLVAVFVFSLGYLRVGLEHGLSLYDEGVVNVGATRILAGELPYRDYWECHAPGQLYLTAAVFKLFGPSVIVGRILVLLMCAALAMVVFNLARLVAGGWAWLVWLLFLAVFYPTGYAAVPAAFMPTGTLGVIASLLCTTLFLQTRKSPWLLGAGLIVGLTALVRQDLGVYSALGEGLVLAGFLRHQRLPLRRLVWFFLPIAAIVGPVVIVFLLKVPWSVLVYNFWTFPLQVFPSTRDLPYPRLSTPPLPLETWWQLLDSGYALRKLSWLAPFYVPPVVYLLTLGWLLTRKLRERCGGEGWDVTCWVALLLLIVGAISFNFLRIRPDLAHLMPFGLPALLLLGLLAGWMWQGCAAGRARAALGLGALGLAAVILVVPGLVRWGFALRESWRPPPYGTFTAPRAAGIRVGATERACEEAVAWVRENVPSNETLFVGSARHDRLFINHLMLYFLTERPPATRYHELHPGVATTYPVQQEIIQDLHEHRTRYVMLDCSAIPFGEAVGTPGARLLDEYLGSEFHLTRVFGEPAGSGWDLRYMILERRVR